eukprot:3996-Heterococcus_DN1.PRE.4
MKEPVFNGLCCQFRVVAKVVEEVGPGEAQQCANACVDRCSNLLVVAVLVLERSRARGCLYSAIIGISDCGQAYNRAATDCATNHDKSVKWAL